MSYIDLLPDDIICHYVLIYLENKDILSLIELFTSREELFEAYFKSMYPRLSYKKSWFDQISLKKLKDILSYKIIPVYKLGILVDNFLISHNKDHMTTKYLINPGSVHTYKDSVYALFSYNKYSLVPYANFVVSLLIRVDHEGKVSTINTNQSKDTLSECVVLEPRQSKEIPIFEEYDAMSFIDTQMRINNGSVILDHLYYKKEEMCILAFSCDGIRFLCYKDNSVGRCTIWVIE